MSDQLSSDRVPQYQETVLWKTLHFCFDFLIYFFTFLPELGEQECRDTTARPRASPWLGRAACSTLGAMAMLHLKPGFPCP